MNPENPALFSALRLAVLGLLLAGPAAWLVLRRRLPPLRPGRPRRFVARLACAALGLGILTAVALATAADVRGQYEAAGRSSELRLNVPAGPEPPLPDPPPNNPQEEFRGRLLLTLALLEESPAGRRIIHAESRDLSWPEEGREIWRGEIRQAGLALDFALGLAAISFARSGEAAPFLAGAGDFQYRWRSPPYGSGEHHGAIMLAGPRGELAGASRSRRQASPLSLCSAAPAYYAFVLFCSRPAANDPLREIPAAEFLRTKAAKVFLPAEVFPAGRFPRPGLPAGLTLAGRIGAGGLLLGIAALLLAQLFRNRPLACAGLAAAVVLFAAAADRLVLAAHLGRAADQAAPLGIRQFACGNAATQTFFFRRAALARLEALRQDPAAPPELRATAALTAKGLRQRLDLSGEAAE